MPKFKYFHGGETEQFSFFRIPRALIKDEQFHGLSTEAKLLYGLMLDRMGLSLRSGWLDEDDRVFSIRSKRYKKRYPAATTISSRTISETLSNIFICDSSPLFFKRNSELAKNTLKLILGS